MRILTTPLQQEFDQPLVSSVKVLTIVDLEFYDRHPFFNIHPEYHLHPLHFGSPYGILLIEILKQHQGVTIIVN